RDALFTGSACDALAHKSYLPRFRLRGATSNFTSWSGAYELAPRDVPPFVNKVPAGPRSASSAACTRRVTVIFRIRSRSASHLFTLFGSGHHGPSVSDVLGSFASLSLTRPALTAPSDGTRDTWCTGAPQPSIVQYVPASQ